MPEPIEQKESQMGLRDLGVKDYLLIMHKRRGIILAIFLFVFIYNIIRTYTQVPFYQATASVRITQRRNVADLLTDWFASVPGDPIASQAKVIESFSVIERVVKELGLVSKDATSEELMRVVGSLRKMFTVEPVVETNVINIVVEDRDRERVALIANKIAESYIQENLKEKAKQARTVKEFIQGQLNGVSAKLRATEDALTEFRKSGKATGVAVPLQNRLADLETTRTTLVRTYTEAHPNVKAINEDINIIKEQIKQMPDLEIEFARLTRETEINEQLYRRLHEKHEDARIAEAENVPDVTLVDPATVPSRPIRPNKQAALILGIFAGLALGLIAGFVVEQLDTSIGTIEDVERLLAIPVLGVIPYLRIEVEKPKGKMPFRKIFLSRKEKEGLRAEDLKKQLLISYSSQSPIAEAYRILRTNIIIEVFKNQPKGKTILITSAGPQEGKSINTSNLGISLAQGGNKVLLVDLDLRRSSIDKIFGLSSPHKRGGLTEVLRGTLTLEDALYSLTDLLVGSSVEFEKILGTPGIDNFNLLVAGSPAIIPTELIQSHEMESLLEKLKQKYDIILFDSPPVLAVADALLFAPKVDAVLLVYKVGKTASHAIMRAKKQLEAVGVSPKGVILNNISPDVEMHSQYYYYRYRQYYSKEEKK